jgi:hypothetical protein
MVEAPLSALLQQVADDVASLPVTAVQLVGAVIAMQHDLPPALSTFIMAKLALRTDMTIVSPAAEALMRIRGSKPKPAEFVRSSDRLQTLRRLHQFDLCSNMATLFKHTGFRHDYYYFIKPRVQSRGERSKAGRK